jgi:outer membrane protein OmpA-like peptidoglycan-associated protein
MASMRRALTPLALAALAGCAVAPPRAAERHAVSTTRAVHLARVRCLVVAPFENASDDPLAADAAAGALVSAIDQNRTRVYPIEDLRALFVQTSLELPEGVSPSLALELGEIIGADAVLYGAVEGRSRGPDPDLMITIRLAATGARDVLFARAVAVAPRGDESLADAVRRAIGEAAAPMLERLGVPGRKVCFDRQRTDRLRLVAAGAERGAAGGAAPVPVTAPLPRPPPPISTLAPGVSRPADAAGASPPQLHADVVVVAAPPAETRAPAPAVEPVPHGTAAAAPALTPRQVEWAGTLAARERLVVTDVEFSGRSAKLSRDAGLADLAAVLASSPSLEIRVEGFVDASNDAADDLRASKEMACAAGKRLAELGVARDRVTCVGRGREDPILPSFTYRGRAANRRIEVVGIP